MTEGDIRAKFPALKGPGPFLLRQSTMQALIDAICETNPIGPSAQDMGTTGTYIYGFPAGGPVGINGTNTPNSGAYVFVSVGGNPQWFGPAPQDSNLYLMSVQDSGSYLNAISGAPPFSWTNTTNCTNSN